MRLKNSIEIKIRVTPEHLQKLNSTGIRNKSEVIRRCIDKTLTERPKTSQNA
jgi:hypothetical protein